MKKHIITLFLLLASEITLQAAITYELNGGITNDYGWMSKSDMFTACLMDALEYDLGISLSEFKQSNSPYDDLFAFFEISHCQKILDNAKWDWLEEYLISEQEGELFAAQLTAGTASKDWRYAIAAFFFESQYDTSSDYSQAGKDEAYIPAWKHAYDNPTSPKKEWTLNAPYKEGATFEGWYTTANFSGEQVTTVNASTSGTLYAKWKEEEVTEYKVVEDDITNLVINPDAMTLSGGPSTNFEVEVYLILSENYNSNGQRLLSDQSTIMVLGMDAIFLDGYAYDIDVATTSAKAVLHVDLNSELYELQLNMNASSQEALEIVIENAVVDTSRLDNGVECFLQMTAEWTNPRDGLTYPIVVEVPSYNPQATVPYEVLCTVTIGGYGNDVPWFGVAEGYLTITTIGNTVTATGMITNEWLNFTANVTISGQIQPPPCDNVYTEFTATFCNEYNWNDITYTQSGDYTQVFTTANGCDSIVTLHLIEDCPVIIDPTHQILYTSTDGNIVTPYDPSAFGANIISNTYENGQGVITFDAPVTTIGSWAFSGCSALSEIVLPESLTWLGGYVFENTGIKHFNLPRNVEDLSFGLLAGCSQLTSITVDAQNKTFDSRNNCNAIIRTAKNELMMGCKNTVIPNEITTILEHAFYGHRDLVNIEIPTNVTFVGAGAFDGTMWYENQPDGLVCINTILYKYKGDAPEGMVVQIPNYITSIGKQAFSDKTNIVEISIPNSVNKIHEMAFSSCTDLALIHFPDTMSHIGWGAFRWCAFDSVRIPEGITYFEGQTFLECKNLSKVILPSTLTSMGDDFVGCTSTDTIYSQNPTPPHIESTFYEVPPFVCLVPCGATDAYQSSDWASHVSEFVEQCEATTDSSHQILYTSTDGNIITPYNSTAFGANIISNTYENGQGVMTFDAPVTTIGGNAFKNCTTLESIIIPDSVHKIGYQAFCDATSLKSINIPKAVTNIEYYFENCPSLASIIVEEGNPIYDSRNNCNAIIETATNTLFTGCKNTIIPNTVVSIGQGAFSGCSSLTSITIPNNVTSVLPGAFRGCTSLANTNYLGDLEGWCKIKFGLGGVYDNANPIAYSRNLYINNQLVENLVIPTTIDTIYPHAFYGCASMKSLFIPQNVIKIDREAFAYCPSLESIVVEGDNLVYDSRNNCNAIIERATNTLVVGCQNTVIPNSVTAINDYSFEGCTTLSRIEIPEGVNRMGFLSFGYCSSLYIVTIPSTMEDLGECTFRTCPLDTVYSYAKVAPSIGGPPAFYEVNPFVSIIPCGTTADYEAKTWNNYCELIENCEEVSRTEEAICAGDEYFWDIDGNSYDESGTYYAHDEEGKHVLELTVYPPTEDTEEYVSIPRGSSYWWNDEEYTEEGTYTETLTDENGCEYTATLHLTLEEPEEASRIEEAICDGDEYFWDVDNNWYNESGTYYAFDEEGKHVLELTIYPPTEDEEEYATIALGETYWWNDMEYDEAGTYTEILYDENGCEYTATLYLTVMEDDSCPIYMCNNREFLSVDDCAWYALDLAELSNGEDLRIVITNEWGGEFAQCDMTLYVERDETAASIFEIYETLQHGQMLDTLVPRSLFEQYEKLYLQISVDASLNILFTYYMPCTQENSMPYTWGTEVSTDGEDAGIYHIDLEQLRRENQSVELSITNSSYDNGFFWMLNYGDNCSQNQCGDDPNLYIGMITKPTANSTEKWILDLAQANETSTDYYFQATLFNDAGLDEELLSGNWVMTPVESRTTLCQNAESIKSGWIYQLQADEQRYYQLDSADICTADALRPVFLTIENLSDSPTECTYSTGICGMEQIMPTITLSAHESKIVPVQLASFFAMFEYKGDYNLSIHTTGDVRVQCTIDGITSEPQHQIRYTSLDGNIITPYNTNAFGANIVSNTYTNGQGLMLFDAPVTSIGNAAFYSCNTLTSIQIPNTVLAIQLDAFTGCNQLTELNIPAKVMSIDRNFISTQYLTVITVDSENQTYDSRNNCNAIIETASNRLLKGCQNTIIPNTVQIIGNSAFANCTALTQIVIPDGVSTIEYGAFNGCSAVETIRSLAAIPPTLESNAFGSISPTVPVYVPCSSLEMYQAEEHWGSIFSNIQCSSVTICYGESYTWHINGKTYTESGTYTHTTNYGKETLYLTVLPEVPVTEIIERICYGTTYQIGGQEYATTGNYTITLQDQNGCDSIINLQLTVLSDVITEEKSEVISSNDIPYYWRGNAYSTTGRYTEVEQYAGTGCDSVIYILDLLVLTTGNYEEQYDTICQSQLPYIWYEQEIHSAGKYSYTEQYVGSAIDSIQHILNLTVIATDYSDEYQTICYGETYTWNGQTYNTPGSYTATLSNIRGCDSIATLHLTVLPEIPTTEEYATICYGETFMWNGITCKYTDTYSAVLASVVTGCDSTAILHLTVLPQSTTETQKVNISVNELPYYWREKWYNESGDYYDTVSYSQFACDSAIYVLTLTVNTTNMCGDNLIWEYANGVLNIKGSGAMYDNPDLLSYRQQPWYPERVNHIVLPDGITHIGDVAFADCANLTNINIPSSVTSLGHGAFSWTGLQSVTIPAGVTTMGEQVFEACNDLLTILYEGNPTTINNQTVHPFIGCVHLDTIITPAALWHCTSADQALEARYGVPHKARYIEVTDGELTKQAMSYIAQNSNALEVLDLTAATNTTLPLGALMNSNRLSYLYLPEQIQTVPEMLAEGCYSLMEIIIPATVTEIGNYAFAGCSNVWRMTVDAVVPPTVYAETFKGIDRTITVAVPTGSEEAYRQAAYWQEFFIENTNSPSPITNCRKLLREDHILILRNGQTYTMMGQPVNIGL